MNKQYFFIGIGLIIMSIVAINVLIQRNTSSKEEMFEEINSTITPDIICPEADNSGYVPCKIYIQFSYETTFQTDKEQTEVFITSLLQPYNILNPQVFYFPENNLIEVIVQTPLGQEDIIGEQLTKNGSSYITSYGRLSNKETGE